MTVANSYLDLVTFTVMDDTLQYFVNKRGKPYVMDNRGYKYGKEKDYSSKTYWICNHRHISKCYARLNTGNDNFSFHGEILKYKGQHNHSPTNLEF